MLVLLPPSETKHPGGDGPPLDLGRLGHPELTPVRERLLTALEQLATDLPAARAALGLSPAQDGEIARNAVVRTSPTLPALDRYTGVLYDALDVGSMTRGQRRRADARLAVGSALFGVVRGTDRIPAYRFSAGSALPGRPTLAARWRPLLDPVLAELVAAQTVVDLRSGSYAALGRVPGAITVNVLSERADGSRSVVSHFNKAHKGRLARALAVTRAEPSDSAGVAAVARRAGMRVERRGTTHLDVIVPG